MHKSDIAVIGDKDSILAFKAIGIDVYSAVDKEEAEKRLKLLAREYKIIYITEELAVLTLDIIARYKQKAYPIVIPIPSATGSNGIGINGIKKDVEKAIGTDILFNREDK